MHVMYHNISAYSSWSVFSITVDSTAGFVNKCPFVPNRSKDRQSEGMTETRREQWDKQIESNWMELLCPSCIRISQPISSIYQVCLMWRLTVWLDLWRISEHLSQKRVSGPERGTVRERTPHDIFGSRMTLTEVLCTPSSTRPGFELMTSISWQYISCHWQACSNHLAINDFSSLFFILWNLFSMKLKHNAAFVSKWRWFITKIEVNREKKGKVKQSDNLLIQNVDKNLHPPL